MAGSTPSVSKQTSEIGVLYDRGMRVTLHESRLPGLSSASVLSDYAFSTYCKLALVSQKLF